MTPLLTILNGDAITQLTKLPDRSVQCCVTSPPYWGLRDYGTATWNGGDPDCKHEGDQRYYTEKTAAVSSASAFSEAGEANAERLKQGRWRNNGTCVKCGAVKVDAQLGLEKTPEEYVCNMVQVFREVRRVLADDGTCWINLGDSYAASLGQRKPEDTAGSPKQLSNAGSIRVGSRSSAGLKPKDLVGIPWMVAFALRADGWYLRSDIIWHKPNPMPESVTDRPTKAHEYLFLLTKSQRYYYDAEAIREPASTDSHARIARAHIGHKSNPDEQRNGLRPRRQVFPAGWGRGDEPRTAIELQREGVHRKTRPLGVGPKSQPAGSGVKNNESFSAAVVDLVEDRNKRSVWSVCSSPFPDAHFATYPPDLIKPCILAGSKPDDTILDPFGGSGTTGMVALELGRKAVLIELNPAYVKLIEKRCDITPGLALA